MKLPNTIRSPYNYKPIPIIPIHKQRPYSKSHCPTQHSTHTRSRIFPTVTTNITKQIISPNLNLALYTVPSNFTAYLTYNPPLQTPNTYQLTRELFPRSTLSIDSLHGMHSTPHKFSSLFNSFSRTIVNTCKGILKSN